MHFKINLSLIAVLIIALFFNIPFYNNWLTNNLLNPNFSISNQMKVMEPEKRRIARFGYSYIIFNELTEIFKKAKIVNPVILLPPDQYLKDNNVKDMAIVEPAIYYYFTSGNRAVWYNSPDVAKANCAMVPDGKGKVMLIRINNQQELDSMVSKYKKYKID